LSAVAPKSFIINDRERASARSGGTVLLDVLRDDFGLTGTKEGCREGDCGTCVVLLGSPSAEGVRYKLVNSCLLPVGDAVGCHIVTIEGLNQSELSPVQQALVEEGAIQCGFCTPGLVIALTGFLMDGGTISEADGVAALGGNICRCTGHVAIKRAIARLAKRFADLGKGEPNRMTALVEQGVLPDYFLDVPERLRRLPPAVKSEPVSPTLVAGGTDLFVTQAETLRNVEPEFLSRRADLLGIRIEDGVCRIGAATPLSDIESSPLIRAAVKGFAWHFGRVAAISIRNRSTLAGNIVNASPAADMSIMLLALDATLVLARRRRRRDVPLREFFRGYKVLDLAPDELIAEIRFPVPPANAHFGFEKVARRERMDIASVSSAILLRVQDECIIEAHVSAGSVAPVPLYLRRTSAYLRGKPISGTAAREAAAVAAGEIAPIGDVRGSAEYKRALLPRLIKAHFVALFPGLIGEGDVA
jgi:xanthine dehydrogenase small subunit